MSGGVGSLDPPTVGEEVSITLSTPKRAAATTVVAEEASSVSAEDQKAHIDAMAQDAEAVADAKEAEAEAEADGDGGLSAMSWTDFVMAYKRLSEPEIDFILSRPRKPFESTFLYKQIIVDSSVSKEELEREAVDHEYHEDELSELRERVHNEYAEKGFVAVIDDEIARRLEFDQFFNQSLREKLAELILDFSDDE